MVPRDYDDVSGLTGPRVGTTVPAFTVSPLTEDVPATGGEVTVNITANVAWTATTLTGADYIESVTPTSGTGSETVKVVFKENTDTENTRTASIQFATTEAVETQSYTVTFTQDKAAGVGADGSFAASWNMEGVSWGEDQMPVTSAPADVTIGDLTKHGFTSSGNSGSNNWGGSDFSDNLEDIVLTAPVKYATFTVSAAGKTLSLSSLAAVVRITKVGPTAVSIQYSLDGTTFAEAGRLTYTRPSKTTTFPVQSVDLSGVAALQNVAAGTTVTIRIVPVATEGTTTGNFYLHSDDETTPALELTGTVK